MAGTEKTIDLFRWFGGFQVSVFTLRVFIIAAFKSSPVKREKKTRNYPFFADDSSKVYITAPVHLLLAIELDLRPQKIQLKILSTYAASFYTRYS